MYRKQLPRIYELRDMLPTPLPPDAYFRDLDRSLAEIPQKLRQFRDIEADLEGLDPIAWQFLKSEVAPLLTARDPVRHWEPLFDKLNQAKAYNYLKKAGYADVSFVPVSPVPGQRTPDLRATAGAEIVLCEVKTINISEDEMRRQSSGGVATITDTLDPRFFRKLAWDLAKANDQMFAFDSKPTRKKIVYLIVNYDDRLHEYAERYQRQIADFLSVTHPTDVEIVFDIKPPFYTAMS